MNKWDQARIAKYKQISIDIMNESIENEEVFIDFTVAKNEKVEGRSWWWTLFVGPFSLLSSLFQPELCVLILTNKRLILAGMNYVGMLVSNPSRTHEKTYQYLKHVKSFH